ncbi:MAG: protein kinase [Gammaproteobacteria bacterium]|nr:protein kinase [Gammaproteobacteria bacterium]NNL00022.1 protein kinase [Xanthomonadales bacterium]
MSLDINIPGYELIEEIGAGGMAKVYLGMQVLLERKVAIKILHQRLSAESDEFKKRFFTEGKVLAKLAHDNIVRIIDIGEADGYLYMAMEYVENGTLTDWLKKQELTVDQAIQICSKVGLALHATHMKHIVHRDLKPSNILLRDINTPLLTDFGIARQTDDDQGLTQTGHILGTLQYMSPEQIRGLHVDHRSDIYALGLMFYRLLVGRLPFVANSQYDLSRMQCEEIPPPLPPHLADIQPVMDAMLAKDPEDRFQSCLEFCKAVQNLSVTDQEYASELEGATRIYDSSQLSASDFRSGRHSDQYSDRHSGQFSQRHSGQFTGQTDPRTSGTYEQTRMMPDQHAKAGSGKLKKILMFGLPVLALVIAATLYFTIWYVPTSGLSEADLRRVENYLRRVDANLGKLQIDSPAEDNAVYELRKALALAPNYGPALDRAREVAEFYEIDARDLIDEERFEEAVAEIQKGLEIDPEYENLLTLNEELTTMLAEQQRQADIADALQVAANYLAQGMLVEPGETNAYAAYQKVLELDPQNITAIQGLDSVLTGLLNEVEQVILTGDLELAGNETLKVASLFPNSRRVNDVQTRIASALRGIREQEEVAEFLSVAQQQLDEGKFIEPDGDNALDSYTEVLNRLPDNQAAIDGLTQIAAQFTAQANEALSQQDFAEALRLAGNGLLAAPDNAELLSIQTQSTGQLSARDQEIQEKLQVAQRLVLSGEFLPPGENALDTFKAVEELDPGNLQAARGLSRLPDQVFEEASQQAKLENFSGARDLLEIAQQAFPDQERFAAMKSEMNNAIAQQEKEELLQDLLETGRRLIASQPLTLDTIDSFSATMSDIEAQFPGNLTAAEQVGDFVNAVNSRARQVSAGGSEDSGVVLLDRALSHFEGNQQLLNSRNALEKAKADRLAEEARRLAAMMGQLAIDAVPWGEVTEIRDAEGNVQQLPASNSTPMLVKLMAGSYTVSIRDSEGGTPQNLSVNVIAQQTAVATARFDSLTADAYFERSSW